MTIDERLSEVYSRGLRGGIDTLTPDDRELYLIQDFIIRFEMDGLTGYFYNLLPDIETIRAAIAAMKNRGLTELAALLSEATDLFREYPGASSQTTWGQTLKQCDPGGRLEQLHRQILALEGYGLDNENIA